MFTYDNSKVRRAERTIDKTVATDILRDGQYGVLSIVESRGSQLAAYGIPLNYVWDTDQYIYFHCAPQGYKLDCLDREALVCFTVVGATNLIAHKFTTAYQSIVVRGKLERKLSPKERMEALVLLLDKYSPNDKETGLKYTEKSFHRTEVLRLKIDTVSGKGKHILP